MIEKRNKAVRYHEWGDKESTTIICLHGLGSTGMSFIELGELFKDKYHIISVDLPGHGGTNNIYNLDQLLRWLKESINSITTANYYLLGHSLGGWIALHYAATHPDKVNGVILLDGGYHQTSFIHEYYLNLDKEKLGFTPSTSIEEDLGSCEKFYKEHTFSSLEEYLNFGKEGSLRWNENLERASLDTVVEDGGIFRFKIDVDAAKTYIKMMYDYPTEGIYQSLDMPILLLRSNEIVSWHWDEIRCILCERFKKMTNAEVITVKASHNVHWDRPKEVLKLVREWIENEENSICNK